MKKIILAVVSFLLAITFLTAAANPSLDGRAIVANENIFPKGNYGKAPGYLPGDVVIVTNYATGMSLEVMILETSNASDGIAVLLSPEAAKELRIQKDTDVYVKIQKKQLLAYEKTVATENGKETKSKIDSDPDKNPDKSLTQTPALIEKVNDRAQALEQYVVEKDEEPVEETPAVAKPVPEPVEETPVVAKPVPELVEEIPVVAESAPKPVEMEEMPVVVELEPEIPVVVSDEPVTVPEIAEADEPVYREIEVSEVREIPEEMPIVVPLDDIAVASRTEDTTPTEIVEYESVSDEHDVYKKLIEDLSKKIEPEPEVTVLPATPTEPIPVPEIVVEPEPEVVSTEKIEVAIEPEPIAIEKASDESFVGDGPKIVSTDEKEYENNTVLKPVETFEPIIETIDATISSDPVQEEPLPEPVEIVEETEDETLATLVPVDDNVVLVQEDNVLEEEPNVDEPVIEEMPVVVELEDLPEPTPVVTEQEVEVVTDGIVKIDEEIPTVVVDGEEEVAPIIEPTVTEVSTTEEEPFDEIPIVVELEPIDETEPVEIVKLEEVVEPVETVEPESTIEPEPEVVEETEVEKTHSKLMLNSSADFEKDMYYIQLATMRNKENIDNLVKNYGQKYPLNIIKLENDRGYQILIGPLSTDEYSLVLARFKARNFKDAFVRKGK